MRVRCWRRSIRCVRSSVQTCVSTRSFLGGSDPGGGGADEPGDAGMCKTGDRSGAAWQAVLSPFTNLEFVISDAAKGIAAGVQAVVSARSESASTVPLEHGLDVFHTNQEARRVLAGPWRRAEAAWEEAEAADTRVAEIKRHGQDARGAAQSARRAWEEAERLLAEVDPQESAWQRARAALAVFRPDGTLNERAWAEAEIQAALTDLRGPEWKKVRNFLNDRTDLEVCGSPASPPGRGRAGRHCDGGCDVGGCGIRRGAPASMQTAQTVLAQVQALLDAKVRDGQLTAAEQAAYDRVAQVLRTTVRASSAVEGINSVLRMQQGRHRKMTQGLLDLKRLYWNCRPLQTGKRRGRCPYEMLGVPLPSTDFWTLLRDECSAAQPPGRRSVRFRRWGVRQCRIRRDAIFASE